MHGKRFGFTPRVIPLFILFLLVVPFLIVFLKYRMSERETERETKKAISFNFRGIDIVREVSPFKQGDTFFWRITGEKRGRLFAVIPVRAPVTLVVDIETDAVKEMIFPWWSFTVWW